MCSVAALTEYPALIRNLFLQPWPADPRTSAAAADEDGIYDLQFCKDGSWACVRVDDYVPCRPGPNDGPVFSQVGHDTDYFP